MLMREVSLERVWVPFIKDLGAWHMGEALIRMQRASILDIALFRIAMLACLGIVLRFEFEMAC